MIDPDTNQDTSLIRRTTKIQPTRNISHYLIGRPLQTADAPHQTIGKTVGLAVFASDALSSTAYATQEILVILAAAGTIAFGYVFPISIVIVGLLAIVVISYEQIIHAYPNGGGAYIVASDNFGKMPALVAAAALLTDYILTVSVSNSSGVAQIVSAYPALFDYRVPIVSGNGYRAAAIALGWVDRVDPAADLKYRLLSVNGERRTRLSYCFCANSRLALSQG